MNLVIRIGKNLLYSYVDLCFDWIRNLDEFILEKGGEPIRNIVFTSWRSGSTFLGDLLNAHPGTFYHYEPLLPLGIVQVIQLSYISFYNSQSTIAYSSLL